MSQDKETAAARGAARPDPVHTDAALKKFADALTSYVLDPMQWAPLLGELDRISNNLSSWDPSELLSQLSRAESLSWQIRQESDELPNSGFAWVLLDNRSRATGSSGNLNQLSDYLSLEPGSLELRFATESSRLSYEDARARLKSADDGHILVELSHDHHNGHRFGYLVAVEGLPDSLQRISSRTAMAMFIAEQQPTDRLRRVAQASFSLTDSETDVVLKVASGMTLKQAAAELGISVNTVRNHLQAAFDKSGTKYPAFVSESFLQFVGNFVECSADVVTQRRGTADDGNSDKSCNQAIFDSCCAGLVFQKILYKFHFNAP